MENQELVGQKLWIVNHGFVRGSVTIERVTPTMAIINEFVRLKLPLMEYNSPIGDRYSSRNYCLETPQILALRDRTIEIDRAKESIAHLSSKYSWMTTEQLKSMNDLVDTFRKETV